MNFDVDELLSMGIKRAYVAPYTTNNENLRDPSITLRNLEWLREKSESCRERGLDVYPFFVTINHPEGNFQIPDRYRLQRNLDGSVRPEFICFRDKVRQAEMIQFSQKAAELGFARMMFDDDLRDAFCYCDEHLRDFSPFEGLSRSEIASILNGVLTDPRSESIRIAWYRYKREGMEEYAKRLERAVHAISPSCRIGICTSAKRCQDFSGRSICG